jgi:ABC-type multidrug transport system fused ATPase/permease subunit
MNVVTFACYTKIAKQELTIPVAFAGIAVFQMVQTNIGSLPPRIFFYLNTLISVRRLHRFLDEAEIPSDDTGEAPESRSNGPSVQRATGIGFEDATFEYPKHEIREEDASTFTLSCPTFEIPAGQVTLVCGDNASGKSSLLMAILGGQFRLKPC